MRRCLRCDRYHSGMCGIPRIGVRIGISGRNRPTQDTSFDVQPFKPKGKRHPIRPSVNNTVQAEAIAQARSQEKELQKILRGTPFDLPVYNTIMDRLDKVQRLIELLQKKEIG